MPLPLALPPLALAALRVGAVAAVTYYAVRLRSVPKDAESEHALDRLPERVELGPHRAEAERGLHGQGRFRRVLRLKQNGPGIEIDGAALARLRIRRV
jgi:hypothetical protein